MDSWQAFFGRQTVTTASSFAGLGGDSLSYVSAYLSLEDVLGEVPDRWTTMTIAELAATAQPAGAKRSALVTIESAILMRAVAICVVVGSHFQLFFSGGAGTSALLWVSGSIFGALQLREMDHDGRLAPIGRLLKSILIPLYLIELPQFLAKLALHAHARLSSVLLTTDLLDYTGLPSSGPDAYGGHEYLLWYIHAVVHILIVYAALLLVVARYVLRLRAARHRRGVRAPSRSVLPAASAAGALPAPGFWAHPVDPMSYFNHAPTTHLATFALAALSGLTAGRWRWRDPGRDAGLRRRSAFRSTDWPTRCRSPSSPPSSASRRSSACRACSRRRSTWSPARRSSSTCCSSSSGRWRPTCTVPALLAWPIAVAGGVAVWAGWNWISQRFAAAGLDPGAALRCWRLASRGSDCRAGLDAPAPGRRLARFSGESWQGTEKPLARPVWGAVTR